MKSTLWLCRYNRLIKFFSVNVVILFNAFPLFTTAQTNSDLSLNQAIQLGIENSKQLQFSKAKLDIANASYNESTDMGLPSVKLSAGYTRLSEVPPLTFDFPGVPPYSIVTSYENNYASAISGREVIFSGFRLKYALASVGFIKDAAVLDVENDKDAVAMNIVNAYFNLYKLYQTLIVVDQNLEEVRQHVTETGKWVEHGIATQNDLLRWQLQESNIQLTKLDVENGINVANYNLNLLLGLPEGNKIQIDSSGINDFENLKSAEEYQQLALTNRSDLQSLDLKNKAALNNLKIAQNSYYPQLSINADFNYSNPNPRYFPQVNVFKSSWDAGVTLSFDVTNLFSNRHSIDENNALVSQGNAVYSQTADKVKSEVYESYISCTEASAKLKVLQQAVYQARKNYDQTNAKYHNSVVLLSDLIDAETLLLQSQVNLVMGKSDAKVAYYKLLRSTGTIH